MTNCACVNGDLFDLAEPRPLLNEGLLYSGSRDTEIPRQLFTDNRLTPLERNAWLLFRMTLVSEGITPLPTYDQLQPYMTMVPCGAKASHETIARALTLLRLSRWMTLFQKRRDRKTGRMLTHLYVLHDSPLTPFDAIKLDPGYLTLVCQSLRHASKAIQRVARRIAQEIFLDPQVERDSIPEALLELSGETATMSDHQLTPNRPHADTEAVTSPLPATHADVRPPSDAALEAPSLNPKSPSSTSRTKKETSTGTAPHPEAGQRGERQPLSYPRLFTQLKADQQSDLKTTLARVAGNLQQGVLDEWSARCCNQQVRNPAGYLYGLLKKALRGEFKPWACRSPQAMDSHLRNTGSGITLPAATRKHSQPTLARNYLSELRSLLKPCTQGSSTLCPA